MHTNATRTGEPRRPALSADLEQYLMASYAHNTHEATTATYSTS
jgi:hypothetical protein